jgi:hypothetical protein
VPRLSACLLAADLVGVRLDLADWLHEARERGVE